MLYLYFSRRMSKLGRIMPVPVTSVLKPTPLHEEWCVAHHPTQVKHQSTDSRGISFSDIKLSYIYQWFTAHLWLNCRLRTVPKQSLPLPLLNEVYETPDVTKVMVGKENTVCQRQPAWCPAALQSFVTTWRTAWYSVMLIFLDSMNNIPDLFQSMCKIVIFSYKCFRYSDPMGGGGNGLDCADNSS
jgi:hypothetical protein